MYIYNEAIVHQNGPIKNQYNPQLSNCRYHLNIGINKKDQTKSLVFNIIIIAKVSYFFLGSKTGNTFDETSPKPIRTCSF